MERLRRRGWRGWHARRRRPVSRGCGTNSSWRTGRRRTAHSKRTRRPLPHPRLESFPAAAAPSAPSPPLHAPRRRHGGQSRALRGPICPPRAPATPVPHPIPRQSDPNRRVALSSPFSEASPQPLHNLPTTCRQPLHNLSTISPQPLRDRPATSAAAQAALVAEEAAAAPATLAAVTADLRRALKPEELGQLASWLCERCVRDGEGRREVGRDAGIVGV